MTSQFHLVGLSAPLSGTLELMDTDKHTFWAPFAFTKAKFKELFNWAKNDDNFWKAFWIANVEHDGLNEDGTPKNPKIISIEEK